MLPIYNTYCHPKLTVLTVCVGPKPHPPPTYNLSNPFLNFHI